MSTKSVRQSVHAMAANHLPSSAENGGRGGNRRKDIRWLNALNEREQRKSWKEGREDARSTDKASPRLPPIPSSLNGYTTGCSARAGAGGRKDVAADRSGLCVVIDAADADVCNNVVAVASAEQEMSHFGERAFGSPSPPDIGPANTWHA